MTMVLLVYWMHCDIMCLFFSLVTPSVLTTEVILKYKSSLLNYNLKVSNICILFMTYVH